MVGGYPPILDVLLLCCFHACFYGGKKNRLAGGKEKGYVPGSLFIKMKKYSVLRRIVGKVVLEFQKSIVVRDVGFFPEPCP